MRISKNEYKEEIEDDDTGKIRRVRRIEYLVKDAEGLVAVFQKRPEAEKFVDLVKQQSRRRI